MASPSPAQQSPGPGAGGPTPLVRQLLTHTLPQQPQQHQQYTFSFTPFLQKTYQHSLPPDRPICKAYLSGQCPLKSHCPERHVSNPPNTSSNPHHSGGGGGGGYKDGGGGFGSLVCKHWLRGLCKKGESCEFLHEYNLRKMPECNFFAKHGFCQNGDECLYLHIDPQSRLPPCPHYDRGFCPLGPRCEKKHVRRKLCLYYLAGFCPEGPRCRDGAHPRWKSDKDMEKPRSKEQAAAAAAQAAAEQQAQQQAQQQQAALEGFGDMDMSSAAMGGMGMGGSGGQDHYGGYHNTDQRGDNSSQMQQGGYQDRGGPGGRDRDRDGGDRGGHDRGGHKDRFGGGGGGRGGRWRGKGRFRGRGH